MPDASPPPLDVPLPPGYTVVEKLGSGGFATVWLAEQGQLGRRVAVKLLGETLEDHERERRFLAECRAIGRLSGHPAVVTVHDAGTTSDGRPYLVMEHLSGGSLHDRLRTDGALRWEEVASIGVHVADALSAAHDTGILHRDVKPANVLLDATGAPKLADFGIARLAEGTATATGHVLGTILFTPPEVLSGQRPAPTADVWALGAMLHTLLTGRSPFQGREDDPPAASIARVLRSEPPPLPRTVPPALSTLIAAMLQADPDDRPQSAAEVARRLQALQAGHGLPVTPARSTRDVVDPARAEADATAIGFAPISAALTAPGEAPPPPGPGVGPTVALGPRAAGAPPAPGGPDDPGAPAGVPGPRGSARRRRGPVLVAVAVVLLLLVVVAGAVLATRGGGDEGEGGTATSATETSTDPSGGPAVARGADQVDSIWGVLTDVPTGTDQMPAVDEAGSRAVDCGGRLRCAATEVDGDPIVAYPADDGTLTVERIGAADGASVWTEPVDTPPSNVALVPAGDVVLLVTSEDDPDQEGATVRTYRALDPAGGVVWGPVAFPADRRVVRAADQASTEVSVLVASGADGSEAIGLSNTDGEQLWTHPGLVLATDATAVYLVESGGMVVARDLVSGEETWRHEVAVEQDGSSPVTRLGVVIDDVLVTVSDGEVLGLAVADGTETWGRQPTSDGDDQTGQTVALSAAGGVAVVVGDAGDMGIDPGSGEVAWRVSRDPLIVPGESNIWVGTADRLVVGQLGSTLRAIATDDGREVVSVDVGAMLPSLSSFGFEGGVAVLAEDGLTAYSTDDLSPLWSDPSVAGATTVATTDGGAVVLGPAGVTLLGAG